MIERAKTLQCELNREVIVKVIPGHFATKHSHISHCIDLTDVKSRLTLAKAAAKLLAANFVGTPIDTVICLDRTKMVGAFLANELSRAGMNVGQDIAVITPEIKDDKLLLRDNFQQYVWGKHVLILTASVTTGKMVNGVAEGIGYYGGTPVGAAALFGCEFQCSVPFYKLFGARDIPEYSSYAPQECPLCAKGVKVDAVVNSYGYSKIM